MEGPGGQKEEVDDGGRHRVVVTMSSSCEDEGWPSRPVENS